MPQDNRDTVLAFYRLGLIDKQPGEAFARFVAPGFIEHKPDVAVATREGAAQYLAELMQELPDAAWSVVRTIAEGDLVFVHACFVPAPGAPPYAIADVFRVEGGLIVEHWDVVAGPVQGARNPHPRF